MTNIHGVGNGYVPAAAAEKAATGPAQSKPAENVGKSPATLQDAANLSGAGSLLATAVTNADDVRSEKVDQVRAAIANGTYNVSASDVADKLLKNMLE